MSVAKEIIALKERRSPAKRLAERVRDAMSSTDEGTTANAAMLLDKLTHALMLLEEADVRRRQLFISALSSLKIGDEYEVDEVERTRKQLHKMDDFSPEPHQSYTQAMAEAATVDPLLLAGANLRLQQFTQAMQPQAMQPQAMQPHAIQFTHATQLHAFDPDADANDDHSNAGQSTLQQAVRNLNNYAEMLLDNTQDVASSQYVGRSA